MALRGIDALRERYPDTCDRTFDRWVARGVLPKPVYILKRRFWLEEELDAFDAKRMAKADAAMEAA
jgi:hypothetical protein